MKTIKFGVIGAAGRGALARLAHQPENGWELVAAADVYEDAFADVKKEIPDVQCYLDYKELLAREDISAVFVMSPDFTHEEYACAALEAGKAVYLEKPLAISIEGCDRVLATAKRTGSKLFLGHNMRHFPVILKMKEVIDSGLIGDIQAGWCRHFINYGGDAYFKDWHSEQKLSNGLLLQKGAHDIDVMHWLMGGYTKEVVGMGQLSVYDKCARRSPEKRGCAAWSDQNWPPLTQVELSPIIDVEDHNMILMQLDNGAQAAYLQCHYTPDAERNYTFIGTKGRVENVGDFGNCEVHVWTLRGERSNPDIIYKIKPIPGSHGGADPQIVKSFMEFVREGKKTNTSPVAARNSVAVGVLGHESMRTDGGRRQIPLLDEETIAYFENGQVK